MGLIDLIPGHVLPLCAGCTHRLPDLSHSAPCAMVRWEGTQHMVPTLTTNATGEVACPDFSPNEETNPTPT